MKTLVVEDDFVSSVLLDELLKGYGPVTAAVSGKEAVAAALDAFSMGEPYDLICLDIMMPEMDGQEVLRQIRSTEAALGLVSGKRARVFMTTALADLKNVRAAIDGACDAYLLKPIDKARLLSELRKFGLIP